MPRVLHSIVSAPVWTKIICVLVLINNNQSSYIISCYTHIPMDRQLPNDDYMGFPDCSVSSLIRTGWCGIRFCNYSVLSYYDGFIEGSQSLIMNGVKNGNMRCTDRIFKLLNGQSYVQHTLNQNASTGQARKSEFVKVSFVSLFSNEYQRWGLESLDSDSSRTRVPILLDSTRTRVLHIWTRTRDMRTRTRLGLGPSGLDQTRQTAQIRIDSICYLTTKELQKS